MMRSLLAALFLSSSAATLPAQPLRYLALGDSYTCGQSVSAGDRYPVQLATRLGSDASADHLKVIAETGWTTADLIDAVKGETGTYDLVTLLIGVNNQYEGLPIEDFRREFTELLGTATRFAGQRKERVVVLSIPDWGASPLGQSRGAPGISRQIDAFNKVVQEQCTALVDVTRASRSAAGHPQQFANDGLHFSGAQYALWAEAVLPAAKRALGR